MNHTKWKQNYQIGEKVFLKLENDIDSFEPYIYYIAKVIAYRQSGYVSRRGRQNPRRYKLKILNKDLENTYYYAFEYEMEKIK